MGLISTLRSKKSRRKLGARTVRILIPIGSEENLRGQIDVLNKKAVLYKDDDILGSTYDVADLDADQLALAGKAYSELLEAVADVDEQIGEMFLMEEPISVADLKAGLRRATIANQLVPIAGGSAFKNKGVQYLLDAVVDYLPSPLEIPAAEGLDPESEEKIVKVETTDDAKFCALAFKLWADKYFGKLIFFRIYSGTVSKGDMIYNPRTQTKERVGRLIQVQADKHEGN